MREPRLAWLRRTIYYQQAEAAKPPMPPKLGVCDKCKRHIGRGVAKHRKACKG